MALEIDAGFARHIWASQDLDYTLTTFFKTLFIAEGLYILSIPFAKYSILALYWRIFNRDLKWPVLVIAGTVTCWAIGSVSRKSLRCLQADLGKYLTVIFSCIPVGGFWDKSIPSICGVNNQKFYYGNSIPNITTDAFLLLLPTYSIWKLQISRGQKLMLSLVFLLGGLYVLVESCEIP